MTYYVVEAHTDKGWTPVASTDEYDSAYSVARRNANRNPRISYRIIRIEEYIEKTIKALF